MDDVLSRMGFELAFDPSHLLFVVALAAARLVPIFTISPFFGGRLVPPTIKIAVALAFVALVYPTVSAGAAGVESMGAFAVLALFLKEIAVGIVLGYLVAIPFYAAEGAGRLADTARGASMAEVFVPQTGTRSSPFGDLSLQLAVLIFFAIDGHLLFFNALATSYEALPLVAFPSEAAAAGLAELAIRVTSHLILVTLGLAAPVLAALFLSDLALGLINRVSPQIQVFFLGMPAKAIAGVAVFLLALTGLTLALRGELAAALQSLRDALVLF